MPVLAWVGSSSAAWEPYCMFPAALIDRLIDWLINWLMTHCLMHWLINQLIDWWLIVWCIDWSIDWLMPIMRKWISYIIFIILGCLLPLVGSILFSRRSDNDSWVYTRMIFGRFWWEHQLFDDFWTFLGVTGNGKKLSFYIAPSKNENRLITDTDSLRSLE